MLSRLVTQNIDVSQHKRNALISHLFFPYTRVLTIPFSRILQEFRSRCIFFLTSLIFVTRLLSLEENFA